MTNIQVILRDNQEVEKVYDVTSGDLLTIQNVRGVNYELYNTLNKTAPQNIIARRVGQDLLIILDENEGKGSSLEIEPDILIKDYYGNIEEEKAKGLDKSDGEVTNATGILIGLHENGKYYAYIPESAETVDAVSILEDGDAKPQAIGGDELAYGVFFPWWGLLGLFALIPLFYDDSESSEHTEPTVIELPNIDEKVTQNMGDPVTIDIIEKSKGKLDPKTIKLLDKDGKEVTVIDVADEGTWTVDPNTGKITFTPDIGFEKDPTPIKYTGTAIDGTKVKEPSIIKIEYKDTIENDVPTLTIEATPVVEGEESTVTVKLNKVSNEDIVVMITKPDGTKEDVTIVKGQKEASIKVPTTDDGHVEATQHLPVKAVVKAGTTTNGKTVLKTTIEETDNDQPTVSLVGDEVVEGENATIIVRLDKVSTTDVVVALSKPNGEEVEVIIPKGEKSKKVIVATAEDENVEDTQNLIVKAVVKSNNTTNGTNEITATIVENDNDVPTLTIEATPVVEGEESTVTVKLNKVSNEDIVVTITKPDGTKEDVTIVKGQKEASIKVPTTDDGHVEATQHLPVKAVVKAGTTTNGKTVLKTTIEETDNDQPTVSLVGDEVVEGENATIIVRLDKVSTTDVVVALSKPNGEEVEVIIPKGEKSKKVIVATAEDENVEDTQNLIVKAVVKSNNTTNGTNEITATIVENDNDVPTLTIEATPVVEGEESTVTVKLNKVSNEDIVVTITKPDGTKEDVTIVKGQKEASIKVATKDDQEVETVQELPVKAVVKSGDIANSKDPLVTKIIESDNDNKADKPTLSIIGDEVIEGETATVTLVLDKPSNEDVVVTLTEPDNTTVDITIPKGDVKKTVEIATKEDGIVEDTQKLPVRAVVTSNNTTNGNTAVTTEIEELDNDKPTVSLSATSVVEGNESTITVSLDKASNEPIVVTVTKPNGDKVDVTIPKGATSQTIQVETEDDGEVEDTQELPIVGVVKSGDTTNGKTPLKTVIEETDNDKPTLSIIGDEVIEGETATVTLVLDKPSNEDVVVTLTEPDNTTVDITIPKGDVKKTVEIATKEDGIVEDTQKLPVRAVVTSNNTTNGNTAVTTEIEELDNDKPTVSLSATSVVEGNESTITVSLDKASNEPIVVTVTKPNGDKVDVTIPKGATSQTIQVETEDDGEVEDTQELPIVGVVKSGDTTNGKTPLKTVIEETDNDKPTLSIIGDEVIEGETATVTLVLDKPSNEDVVVTLTKPDNTTVDITIPKGDVKKTVEIVTKDDSEIEDTLDLPVKAVVKSGKTTNGTEELTASIVESDNDISMDITHIGRVDQPVAGDGREDNTANEYGLIDNQTIVIKGTTQGVPAGTPVTVIISTNTDVVESSKYTKIATVKENGDWETTLPANQTVNLIFAKNQPLEVSATVTAKGKTVTDIDKSPVTNTNVSIYRTGADFIQEDVIEKLTFEIKQTEDSNNDVAVSLLDTTVTVKIDTMITNSISKNDIDHIIFTDATGNSNNLTEAQINDLFANGMNITIPAGSTGIPKFDIYPKPDTAGESNEVVKMKIENSTNVLSPIGQDSQQGTIIDNDLHIDITSIGDNQQPESGNNSENGVNIVANANEYGVLKPNGDLVISGTSDAPNDSVVTLTVATNKTSLSDLTTKVKDGHWSYIVPKAQMDELSFENGKPLEVTASVTKVNLTVEDIDKTNIQLALPTIDIVSINGTTQPADQDTVVTKDTANKYGFINKPNFNLNGVTTEVEDGKDVTITITDANGTTTRVTTTVINGAWSVDVTEQNISNLDLTKGNLTFKASVTNDAAQTATDTDLAPIAKTKVIVVSPKTVTEGDSTNTFIVNEVKLDNPTASDVVTKISFPVITGEEMATKPTDYTDVEYFDVASNAWKAIFSADNPNGEGNVKLPHNGSVVKIRVKVANDDVAEATEKLQLKVTALPEYNGLFETDTDKSSAVVNMINDDDMTIDITSIAGVVQPNEESNNSLGDNKYGKITDLSQGITIEGKTENIPAGTQVNVKIETNVDNVSGSKYDSEKAIVKADGTWSLTLSNERVKALSFKQDEPLKVTATISKESKTVKDVDQIDVIKTELAIERTSATSINEGDNDVKHTFVISQIEVGTQTQTASPMPTTVKAKIDTSVTDSIDKADIKKVVYTDSEGHIHNLTDTEINNLLNETGFDVVIPANSTGKPTFDVVIENDDNAESTEIVKMTISETINMAQKGLTSIVKAHAEGTIVDNDLHIDITSIGTGNDQPKNGNGAENDEDNVANANKYGEVQSNSDIVISGTSDAPNGSTVNLTVATNTDVASGSKYTSGLSTTVENGHWSYTLPAEKVAQLTFAEGKPFEVTATVTKGNLTAMDTDKTDVQIEPTIIPKSAHVSEEGLVYGVRDNVGVTTDADTTNAVEGFGKVATTSTVNNVDIDALNALKLTQNGEPITWEYNNGSKELIGKLADGSNFVTVNFNDQKAGEGENEGLDYKVTLHKSIDHTGGVKLDSNNSGANEQDLTIPIQLTTADGSSISTSIVIEDDSPNAEDVTKSVSKEDSLTRFNIMLTIDGSGSMVREDQGESAVPKPGGGFYTKWELAVDASLAVLQKYEENSRTMVKFNRYSDGLVQRDGSNADVITDWMTVEQAKAFLLNDDPKGGNSNFAKGLRQWNETTNDIPYADKTISYFITDGNPEGSLNPWRFNRFIRKGEWQDILNTYKVDMSYAVAVGRDADDNNLMKLSYDREHPENPQAGLIRVENGSLIKTAILQTVKEYKPIAITQSLLEGDITSGTAGVDTMFGGDGGFVSTIRVEGKTYTYDAKMNISTSYDGTHKQGDHIEVTLNDGSTIDFNMHSAQYTYKPSVKAQKAATKATQQVNIEFQLTDSDGDTSEFATNHLDYTVTARAQDRAASDMVGLNENGTDDNDVIAYSNDHHIDGSTGFDVLVFDQISGEIHLDTSKISNIELFDLEDKQTQNITLTENDVLNMTDTHNQLLIVADENDTVTLKGFTQTVDPKHEGVYHTYVNGDATVYVDNNVENIIL
ncbi:Uncharacterised protein [Phocoenobacter uteri]|uniref:VWFA domain-containing protein n=1 Tax=Phocoenobacter uteri TaxID=146806 RepID=A0A379CAW1_9PAST|nr:hypothetical protein [Phocoenobacter uteri]MDG6882652.1 hypothetical protein [Phocoenobacter uteri]SUB58817.1 Uncharacterised protein [Phocoenobacter uteri]